MYCQHCMTKNPDDAQVCEHCHQNPTVAQSPSHHLAPGTVLNGRYLIGEAIGEGGFGITYIGLDKNLDVRIAIKEFFPYGCANRNNSVSNDVLLNYQAETDYFTDVKNRFLQEAKGIAKFSKEPSIVDVRDYFTENNTAYIVMEYIEGITLSQYLEKNGVFEADKIFELMMPLLKALNKMHNEGIIHRDISPENIMMTDGGRLILMDFGSARFYAGDNKRTMSVILKPGYAPFEQYSTDGDQGPWTDVYALCATLYKCITGETPIDPMVRCQNDTLQMPSQLGFTISQRQEQALELGLKVYSSDRLRNINEFVSVLTGSPLPAEKGFLRTIITKRRDPARESNRTYGDAYTRYLEQQPEKKSKFAAILPFLIGFLVFVLVAGGVTMFFVLKNKSNDPVVTPTAAADATTPYVTQAPQETETTAQLKGKVRMPDVVGKEITEARKEIEAVGLVVEEEREESDTVEKNYVISQSVRANKRIKVGSSVSLVVSDGFMLTESPTQPVSTEVHDTSINVMSELIHIRILYYETQSNPGVKTEKNGVVYYRDDGMIKKAVCEAGYNGWDYTREYYYDNGSLYYAVVSNGAEEHKLYYADGTLIRYIDQNGTIMDYGEINCPMESVVTAEARVLLE